LIQNLKHCRACEHRDRVDASTVLCRLNGQAIGDNALAGTCPDNRFTGPPRPITPDVQRRLAMQFSGCRGCGDGPPPL
jgi:hypothetical protein